VRVWSLCTHLKLQELRTVFRSGIKQVAEENNAALFAALWFVLRVRLPCSHQGQWGVQNMQHALKSWVVRRGISLDGQNKRHFFNVEEVDCTTLRKQFLRWEAVYSTGLISLGNRPAAGSSYEGNKSSGSVQWSNSLTSWVPNYSFGWCELLTVTLGVL